MRGRQWATYLWPGLAPLWIRGEWSGLFQAVGFALLVIGLLLVTCIWSELVGPVLRFLGWGAVLGLWSLGAVSSRRWLSRQAALPTAAAARHEQPAGGDLFPGAMREYLRGNWFEAEMLCNRMLWQDARDAEALLLLATLLRRTQRYEAARQRLDELRLLEAAVYWRQEIEAEDKLLVAAQQPGEQEQPNQDEKKLANAA